MRMFCYAQLIFLLCLQAGLVHAAELEYDAANRLVLVRYDASNEVSYAIDSEGNLLELEERAPAPPAEKYGYEAWIATVTNGQTNYHQSATGDGYPNLLKYATGSSPTNSDDFARIAGVRTNGIFSLAFFRNLDATDVTMIVEASPTITTAATWQGLATNAQGSWGGAANVVEAATGTPARVLVNDPSSPAAPSRFMRLRITRP